MTYTVMGRDAGTGEIGIAITTASVNCSKVVPHNRGLLPEYSPTGAIVCSQSMCNPMLAFKALDMLENGSSFEEIQREWEADDKFLGRRQVGIVTVNGDVHCHTGEDCFPLKGHILGDGYVVMGNALGPDCLAGMQEYYEANADRELADRLLGTLEAGRAAGGQQWEGEKIPEFFCSLYVYDGKNPYAATDMRVDFDISAVEKMRRMYDQIQKGTEHYFDTMYRRPDEFDDNTMEYAFSLAAKQV